MGELAGVTSFALSKPYDECRPWLCMDDKLKLEYGSPHHFKCLTLSELDRKKRVFDNYVSKMWYLQGSVLVG